MRLTGVSGAETAARRRILKWLTRRSMVSWAKRSVLYVTKPSVPLAVGS
jgi:hypothetical protein